MILVLAALVVGVASVMGAPFLAIPIILMLPGPLIMLEVFRRQLRQRQIRQFREAARARKTDFDAQDRETLSRPA